MHDVTRLEDLTKGALVRGVLGDRAVRVVDVAWHGSNAVTLTYTDDSTGKPGQELLYRDDEPRLAVEEAGRAWSMDADRALFRLVSEAKRISLAYLFDPFLAVQTSNLDPLPHQIEAVYSNLSLDEAGQEVLGRPALGLGREHQLGGEAAHRRQLEAAQADLELGGLGRGRGGLDAWPVSVA